jgi:ABC-2 type transport system permease protein
MLFSAHRLSLFLFLIPVIALVQFVFTLGFAFLVSAGNVFFRDLGNVMRHLLRLWFYLSPGLYSLSVLEGVSLLDDVPFLRTILEANPFAVLFEAYRAVIWGTPGTGMPGFPEWGALGVLAVTSVVFLAIATVVFKRLEPRFAKVL